MCGALAHSNGFSYVSPRKRDCKTVFRECRVVRVGIRALELDDAPRKFLYSYGDADGADTFALFAGKPFCATEEGADFADLLPEPGNAGHAVAGCLM